MPFLRRGEAIGSVVTSGGQKAIALLLRKCQATITLCQRALKTPRPSPPTSEDLVLSLLNLIGLSATYRYNMRETDTTLPSE